MNNRDSGLTHNNTLCIHSALPEIYHAEDVVLSELIDTGVDSNTLFAVRMALDEALINAYQHGNGCNPEKTIKIDREIHPDFIQITITDEGNGFDPRTVLDPTTPERVMAPNGRGLYLIREFASAVTYNERGNQITIVMRPDACRRQATVLHWFYRDMVIVELFDPCAELPLDEFRQRLLEVATPARSAYVIDLKRMGHANETVVGGLEQFHAHVKRLGGEVVLARPVPPVREALVKASLAQRMHLCADIGAAISLLAAAGGPC